jgi:hypothetical protein
MFGRLIFDFELEFFLSRNTYDKIAMLLINGNSSIINEVGNYIKREDSDMVSYLPKSKYSKIESVDPFSNGIGRISIKIGRFITKFLKKITFINYNISPQDVEIFVNLYKSYFFRSGSSMIVVKGSDISKWYLENTYYQNNGNKFGTLWNSCMRQADRNKFMQLYVDNEEVKMLILLADDGKLLGRAILWDKVFDMNNSEYKLMDRIYTVYDHDVNLFKNWAKENEYMHKTEQSSRSERYITKYEDNNPNSLNMKLFIKLKNHKQKYYPYFDTFKFYDSLSGKFFNNDDSKFEYVLVQSDGELFPPEPEGSDFDEIFDDE